MQPENGKRAFPCKAVYFLAGDNCVMFKVYINEVIPLSYTIVRTLRIFVSFSENLPPTKNFILLLYEKK